MKSGSANVLSEALADRGYKKGREGGTGQRGFCGIAIKPEVVCDTRDALSLYYPYDARARNGDNGKGGQRLSGSWLVRRFPHSETGKSASAFAVPCLGIALVDERL